MFAKGTASLVSLETILPSILKIWADTNEQYSCNISPKAFLTIVDFFKAITCLIISPGYP
jgi:hypothetical protein